MTGKSFVFLSVALCILLSHGSSAQVPVRSEVRQIVTFSFLPGRSTEALSLFRDQAIPLYIANDAMLSFRGFREVESSVPLDLIVVSAFAGMAGMDTSNMRLRALAATQETSIGAIYGQIAQHSVSHTDQFVEMLLPLGNGDPSSRRLTAFIWYRISPGQDSEFEDHLQNTIAPWETVSGIPSATGRLILSDGWHYMRMVGFDSLGGYQIYWNRLADVARRTGISQITVETRQVIVASIADLSVR